MPALSDLESLNLAPRWGSTPGVSLARFGLAGPLSLGGAGLKVLLEVRPAQSVRFPENFIKAKLENAPGLVGAGQVRTSLRGPAARFLRCPRQRWVTLLVIHIFGNKIAIV